MNDTVFIWNDAICTDPFVVLEKGKIHLQLSKDGFLKITNKETLKSFELGTKSFKSLTIHPASLFLSGSLFLTWDEGVSAEAQEALFGLKIKSVTGRDGSICGIHLKFGRSKRKIVDTIAQILSFNKCLVI